MQGSNVSPQQALKTARAGLLTSLIAATQALESDDASPGLVAQALQGVVNAQIPYNNAVVRIPLSVMMEGQVLSDAGQAEPGDAVTDAEATGLLASTNGRKWADHFLAVNKNHAIDREALVGWFSNAILAGRYEGLKENPAATTAPPREP